MEELLLTSPHPLLSSLVAFYIIILVFFTSHFIKIVFSPVLIITSVLLISLLRLGSKQKTQNTITSSETEQQTLLVSVQKDQELVPNESKNKKLETEQNPLFYSFVGAPLEVIYEEEDEMNDEKERYGYPLMYLYCSESDSDESSFEWEGEGLIEIELNGKITNELFHWEEENLIEIDISPAMVIV